MIGPPMGTFSPVKLCADPNGNCVSPFHHNGDIVGAFCWYLEPAASLLFARVFYWCSDVEGITQKTGSAKKFPVFVKMLLDALGVKHGASETVFVDLLTYADLVSCAPVPLLPCHRRLCCCCCCCRRRFGSCCCRTCRTCCGCCCPPRLLVLLNHMTCAQLRLISSPRSTPLFRFSDAARQLVPCPPFFASFCVGAAQGKTCRPRLPEAARARRRRRRRREQQAVRAFDPLFHVVCSIGVVGCDFWFPHSRAYTLS